MSVCGFCFAGGGDDDDVGSEGVETMVVVTVRAVETQGPVAFSKQVGRPTNGSGAWT